MRKHLGLSTLALMAALGVVMPAQAQLLNLGGSDGGVSVNVGGEGGATVTIGGESGTSVDLGGSGNSSGSVGSIIDLGGDDDDDDALIDLGGDGDAVIDLNLDGDDADGNALLDLFGNGTGGTGGIDIDLGDESDLLDVGDADLLDLGDEDDLLDIDNLLGDGGVTGDDVLLELFGDGGIGGDGDVAVDLNGAGDPNDVTVGLDDDSTAVVDLFGNGGLPGDGDATVDVNGQGDPNDVTVGLDDDTTAVVDIFGGTELPSGDGGGNNSTDVSILGDGTPDVTADAGGQEVNVDILGLGGADETSTGGDDDGAGGGDDDGNGGNDDGGPSDGNGNGGDDTAGGDDPLGPPAINPGANGGDDGNGLGANNRIRVAAVGDANAKCFTPNEEQISYLLANHSYDMSMSASWATGEVDSVPVKLCPEARAKLAAAVEADAEIQWLQDAVWSDKRIHGALTGAGLDADNVLALDTKGGEVNVYVF